PNEYKFVGKGEFIIGGKCPDFINVNGQKKIVEMFGDFWHGNKYRFLALGDSLSKKEHGQQRIKHFAKYGYKTLIIWEHELQNENKLKRKIVNFHMRYNMGASHKGSQFERDICSKLSLWWTKGKSDDVFWRTPGSGARAKVRYKKGKSSIGVGDVQATDPIGQPLIDLCTIEIKKGYFKHTYFDLIDKLPNETKQPYRQFIQQARDQQKEAKTFS
ncbi:MAG: hypothetical protein QQN41_13665, partial [Nitrosopumilus sp.]